MAKKGKEKASAPTPPAAAGSTSKKSSKQSAPPKEKEDDFIVFTNSTKDTKPRKQQNGGPSGKAAAAETDPSGPPKPTVKQIIGGSSWTGKLPVNLLSEHCQKQKWGKPTYDNVSGTLDDLRWALVNRKNTDA